MPSTVELHSLQSNELALILHNRLIIRIGESYKELRPRVGNLRFKIEHGRMKVYKRGIIANFNNFFLTRMTTNPSPYRSSMLSEEEARLDIFTWEVCLWNLINLQKKAKILK